MKVYLLLFTITSMVLLLAIYFVLYPESALLQTKPTQNIEPHETKPIASNQWYSSVYKKFPSQPLFAFPLAYQLSEKGLSFSLPKINKTPDTIFANFSEDLSVGIKENFTQSRIEKIGDWSIGLTLTNPQEKHLTFTLAQGAPWTTILTNDERLIIRSPHNYTLYENGQKQTNQREFTTDAFRISVNNRDYAVILPEKQKIQLSPKEIEIHSKQIFIAILDKPENFSRFKENSDVQVQNTRVSWNMQNAKLLTTYLFETNAEPLITLFSHHYDSLPEKPTVLGSYQTLRGTMRLIKASSFTTSLPILIPDITFSKLSDTPDDFLTAVQEDQQKILTDNQPTNGDYFLGAWYGKAANILLLLEVAGLEKEKEELIAYLKPRLAESLTYFTYQNDLQSIIADKPEFGNEKLNDHHFHYGYYIRTAAVLTRMDPEYRQQVEKNINALIGDIATTDRSSKQFPFLRNFAVYEAHSWADGFADFGDGNNQESSSESIGAWYSIYLWAKETNNKELEETALYLYNTEILGARYYWFGKNNVYSQPYDHAIGSIIWGGKVDFSTWFSGKTNMKYGIQILPVTPGSFSYLGTFDNFAKYETDFYTHGGSITDEWGDLFLMFTSFYNPEKALSLKNQVTQPEANTPKSLFLYTIYKNNEN